MSAALNMMRIFGELIKCQKSDASSSVEYSHTAVSSDPEAKII